MNRLRNLSARALASAAVAVVAVYVALPTVETRMGFVMLVHVFALVLCIDALRRLPPSRRRAWRLFTVAGAIYLVGDVLLIANKAGAIHLGFPSVIDALLLGTFLLPIRAFSLLRPLENGDRHQADWGALADALLVSGGLAVASWQYLIEPNLFAPAVPLPARAVSAAYPILDLVLLVVTVRLALRPGPKPRAQKLLSWATASLLVADTLYGLAQLSGTFKPGSWSHGFWLVNLLFIAGAALDPDLHLLSEPAKTEDVNPGWRRQLLMTASTLVGPGLLLLRVGDLQARDLYVYGGVSAALFTLAIARVGGYSRRLAHQARHDALTGLPNRALILERLHATLDGPDPAESGVAVLFIDLDGFKTINDSFGHDVGDELLVSAARRIAGAIRGRDVVGRLGGDEFVVLCDGGASQAVAEAVATRIARAVAEPFGIRGRDLRVTASIGITVAGAGATADAMLRDADAAMYEAKRAGRDRFAVFEEEMHREVVEYFELQAELRRAVEEGQLFLEYQPIVDLASGEPVGFEALVRWQHPERGVLAPAAFIPTAEETGLVVPMGRWVTAEACRQLAAWRASYSRAAGLMISVNVSALQLREPGFVEEVRAALDDAGLEPSSLVLELTETALVDDIDSLNGRLAPLRELGVRIALDDFGTGYSSLLYLARMQVDIIKVDRSFVRQHAHDEREGLLADAIVGLARSLGLDTIAEGIEEPEEAARIRGTGCHAAQGFLFARPMPAADAARWLHGAADRPPRADEVVAVAGGGG